MSIEILHTGLYYGTRNFHAAQTVRAPVTIDDKLNGLMNGQCLTLLPVDLYILPKLLNLFYSKFKENTFLISYWCRYFQAGGTPEQVINQLSQNYTAVAQMANLLAEWLILAGVCVTDVQAMVENHLKDMILRTFDPKKADTIFTEEGEVFSIE